jgi:hypothetical protein
MGGRYTVGSSPEERYRRGDEVGVSTRGASGVRGDVIGDTGRGGDGGACVTCVTKEKEGNVVVPCLLFSF